MIVQNPTDLDIKVSIDGVEYFVGPQDEISNVPEQAANYWKTKLHEFLIVLPDTEVVKKVTEVKEPEQKEVKPTAEPKAEDKKTK